MKKLHFIWIMIVMLIGSSTVYSQVVKRDNEWSLTGLNLKSADRKELLSLFSKLGSDSSYFIEDHISSKVVKTYGKARISEIAVTANTKSIRPEDNDKLSAKSFNDPHYPWVKRRALIMNSGNNKDKVYLRIDAILAKYSK